VGFGGAGVLEFLQHSAKAAYGIEAVTENCEFAVQRGVPRQNLFHADELPEQLPEKIDVWFFLDSFEHIPKPGPFFNWLLNNSGPTARIILVAPQANSVSDLVLGRFWPHKVSCHRFHWSIIGINEFMSRHEFKNVQRFFPIKYVGLREVLVIIAHKLGKPGLFKHSLGLLNHIEIPINIGEMGVLFARSSTESG
jgi:hypothetical protein